MQTHCWRKVFIDLSESIFRELGFPLPAMIFEESLPLSMEFYLDDHQFELLHSENELSDHILISCTLGAVPQGAERRGYRELLKENLSQMRIAGEYFGIDSEKQTLKLMLLKALSSTSAPTLLADMRSVVGKWKSWEEKFFSDDAFSSAGGIPGGTLLLA